MKNALNVIYKKNDFIYIYINNSNNTIMYTELDNFIKKHNIDFNYNNYTNDELNLMNNIIETNNIIKSDNSNIMNFIGLYIEYEYINITYKYYNEAIKLNNNIDAIYNYIRILRKKNKIKEAIKYIDNNINLILNNGKILNTYGILLEIDNRIEEAKEYYLKAIELNNKFAISNYAILLVKENKIEEAKKYYLKAILINEKKFLDLYLKTSIKLGESNIRRYIDLSNFNLELVKKEVNKLLEDKNVIIYKNKLETFSKVDKCNICFEDNKINIQLNCFSHLVCNDCYAEIYDKKCPFCRL